MALLDGIVGCWSPSLGATGYTLLDRTRNANHGTLTSMSSNDWQSAVIGGRSGTVLQFDGSTKWVSQNYTFSAGQTRAATSAWCKLQRATPIFNGSTAPPFSQDSISSNHNHYPWSDGTAYLMTLRQSRQNFALSSQVDRSNWHLLTVTTDGNKWQVWQNNIMVAEYAAESLLSTTLRIGRTSGTSTYYFNGQIGECVVWNRGITGAEINQLYLLGNGWIGQELTGVNRRRRFGRAASNRRRRFLIGAAG